MIAPTQLHAQMKRKLASRCENSNGNGGCSTGYHAVDVARFRFR